jgi:hypothetical protein
MSGAVPKGLNLPFKERKQKVGDSSGNPEKHLCSHSQRVEPSPKGLNLPFKERKQNVGDASGNPEKHLRSHSPRVEQSQRD